MIVGINKACRTSSDHGQRQHGLALKAAYISAFSQAQYQHGMLHHVHGIRCRFDDGHCHVLPDKPLHVLG